MKIRNEGKNQDSPRRATTSNRGQPKGGTSHRLPRALLSACIVATVFTACGGGQTNSSQNTASDALPNANSDTESMQKAVASAVQAAKGQQVATSYGTTPAPVVELHRRSDDGQWVFGGAYFPLPPTAEDQSPVTSLFFAHKVGDRWEVTLEDAADFHTTAANAPDQVVGTAERQLFSKRATAVSKRAAMAVMQATDVGPSGASDVGLSMPFKLNGSNWGTAGVHGDGGNTRPFNAIDFWGGDGRVLTSRAGVAYKFCTNSRWPFIKVVHDNGWTTGYYHTRDQANITNGQSVAEGEFVGMIGVELPCGGAANGNHVHWTLWRGGTDGSGEAVQDKIIGGWTWFEGSQAYSGYAEHNGTRVAAGQSGLVNYGHGGTVTPAPAPAPAPGNPPPSPGPCFGTGCEKFTGTLSRAGQASFHPSSSGFQHAGGPLKAWLTGPAGVDFDLVLGRYNPRTGAWDKVASSEGETADESVLYQAAPGQYRWRINDYSGSGTYTLWTLK